MRRRHVDLLIVAAAALLIGMVNLALPAVAAGRVASVILGVPLVLVLPGYPLSTLLPGPRPEATGGEKLAERLVWSVVISMVAAVAGGFVLDALPGSLSRTGWTILLCAVTLAGTAVAAYRARGARSVIAEPTGNAFAGAWQWTGHRARALVCGVIITVVLTSAVGLAYGTGRSQSFPGFDQLWLAPHATSQVGGQSLVVGVRNNHRQTERYRVSLRTDRAAVSTWTLTLAAGRTWQRPVTAPPGQTLHVTLHVLGQRQAPQTVSWTALARSRAE